MIIRLGVMLEYNCHWPTAVSVVGLTSAKEDLRYLENFFKVIPSRYEVRTMLHNEDFSEIEVTESSGTKLRLSKAELALYHLREIRGYKEGTPSFPVRQLRATMLLPSRYEFSHPDTIITTRSVLDSEWRRSLEGPGQNAPATDIDAIEFNAIIDIKNKHESWNDDVCLVLKRFAGATKFKFFEDRDDEQGHWIRKEL